MKKKLLIIIFITFSILTFSRTKVSFINPGKSDERFWINVSEFMRAAADDLDLDLEVLYADRNEKNALNIMNALTIRVSKPDYIIMVNEKTVTPKLLKIAENNNIKVFMILSDLNSVQKKSEGNPREKYKNWIGTFTPNNIRAGYLIANNLIRTVRNLKDSPLNLIAITEKNITPTSIARIKGLQQSLNENPTVNLKQIVYSEENQKNSYDLAENILKKDKDIDIIWTGDESISLGVLNAVEKNNLKPNKDIFIGGFSWSREILNEVKKRKILCAIDGEFMIGGWALVILKDFDKGKDFAAENLDTELKINLLNLIDYSNIDKCLEVFQDSEWNKIDFRKFSKSYNANIINYDFSLTKILEQF